MGIARFWCFLLLFVPILTAQGPGSYVPGREAGIDLAGNWGPVFHEDAGERGPGPELVNCLLAAPSGTGGGDVDVLQDAYRVRDEDGRGVVGTDEVAGDRLLGDAHETHVE